MAKLPCPLEEWHEFSKLLFEALDLPLEQRAAWLGSLAAEHVHMRPWLAKVLDGAERIDDPQFLRTPAVSYKTFSEFAPDQRIGPYQLERPLGQGGMGEVWLAKRSDGRLNRYVALKLPHAHLLSGSLRQRFERERDILAALSHHHIAQLYDAGISDSGHPYLAMEWIEGIPITRYCREMRLPIEGRLALFRQVLDAVHYAHARFIAHRDLKPSNILATREGQVKLLDFGIAKLLTGDTAGMETALTQLGGRAVTPDYAAPEQLAGQPITTAVDLYALGVVLFELLTGSRPFDGTCGPNADMPLASRRVTDEAAKPIGELSAVRLCKALRGDLDAIIAKALESDPARRYRSAEAFADDLDRCQRHEPISARRIGRFSLIGKFVRRNRLPVALTAGLVFAFLAGSAGIGWEGLRATREAKRAELEAQRAQDSAQRAEGEAKREKATKDFLVSVFKASDPRIASDKPRGTITAKELLDVSSDKIEQEFANDPDTEIELLGLAADIYHEFDDAEQSQKLLLRRIELARARYGELHPIVIEGLLQQAANDNDRREYDKALTLLGQTEILISRAGLDRSALRAWWWLTKSGALTSNGAAIKESEDALLKSVELYAAVAPNDRNYPSALSDLASSYFAKPDFPHAIEYYRRAVAALESQPSGDEGDLVLLYGNLGTALTYVGDFDGAESPYLHATELARRSFGVNHRYYWVAAARYAQTIHLRGDRQRAMQLFEQLLPSIPSGPAKFANALDEHEAGVVNETYGACLSADGRARAAVPYLEAADRQYTESPEYFYEVAHLQGVLGIAYDRFGRMEDARRLIKSTLDKYAEMFKPDNPGVLRQRQSWGSFLLRHGNLNEAEQQLHEVLKLAADPNAFYVALADGDLAQLAIARHDPASAVDFARQAVETFDHVVGFRDVRMGPYLWRIRAEALLLAGDAKGAEDWAQRALDADRRYDDPSSADIHEAEATLNTARKALRMPHT